MRLEIYDLECLSNLFTYTGYNFSDNKFYQFVISQYRNDIEELYNYLFKDKLMMIGFNNESYDYPLLHHLINHYDAYKFRNGLAIAQKLYDKSQELIKMDFSAIADKNKFIPQIDLFKIWHYDSKARATSLKDIEFAMKMDNVEEMPIKYNQWCTEKDIDTILEYNLNDVEATKQFFLITIGKTDYPLYKNKNKLELRQNLKKKFHVDCLNLPDVRIGEALMLNLYSRAIGANPYEIKKLRTERNYINLKDCIPFWCKIESEEFGKFLDIIKNTIIKCYGEEDEEFKESIIFHGARFDFGAGGAHQNSNPGIYKSTEDTIIVDFDISSLYPSIARSLNLYPQHLGPEFANLYEQFIIKRINEKHKPKEQRDEVLINGYKLLLNGIYGKSKEEKSFMFDKLYTYRTTIGGQLFICMWVERMVKVCPELKFIQTNTDGVTIILPKEKLELIREVNDQLTKETSLVIEEVFYSKFVMRDVNNYIAEYNDSTPENEHLKLKGAFEIDKEFHKDPSMRIVPIAVKKYFINNIPVEETIRNHKDIFDFCLRLKTNSKCQPKVNILSGNEVKIIELDRTTRYYISNSGGTLYKDFFNKVTGVNIGYNITIFNKYIEKLFSEYDINYNFYINEAQKLIQAVDDGQMNLFDLF